MKNYQVFASDADLKSARPLGDLDESVIIERAKKGEIGPDFILVTYGYFSDKKIRAKELPGFPVGVKLVPPELRSSSLEPQSSIVFGTILGAIGGFIFVRAFLLTDIESIGFSLFWNNLENLRPRDVQMALSSSTLWKCLIGAVLGGLAAGHGYRIYSAKKKSAEGVASPSASVVVSAEKRLSELSALRDKGLITLDDYEKRKAEIISRI